MRSEHYGKLGVAELPSKVKAIWYSRDDELPELPRMGWSWQQQTDPDLWLMQDFAKRLVEITPLTEAEEQVIGLCVIQGYTLKEAGKMIDKTGARVRQILEKGLRKFRRHQELLTGIKPWELDPREVSWFWWKLEKRRKT